MHHPSLFGSTLRDYLFGAWKVERRIDDWRNDNVARFDGEGVFSAREDDLDYAETGHLTINGQAHQAVQGNRWLFPSDDTAEVLFADGRTFHHITLDGGKAVATHYCAPDDYLATYSFKSENVWHLTWNVTGPRKNYRSRSVFMRLHRPTQALLSGR